MEFHPALKSLSVYEAGKPIELVMREFGIPESEVIKLASNENPHGAPPAAREAFASSLARLHLYPDDSMLALKTALAERFGVPREWVILGAGSDQVLDFAIKARCTPGSSILTARTTFAMYAIYGAQAEAQMLTTPSHAHLLSEFLELYEQHLPEMVFLCVPNNPLGECLLAGEVEEFLRASRPHTLVVLDGAYQEYAKRKNQAMELEVASLVRTHPNLLYTGTFSKAWGLGGLRIGYGIAQPEIITALMKLRPPFNVSTPALASALAALGEDDFVERCVRECFSEMERYERFAEELGLSFIPSYTNFITLLLEEPRSSTELSSKLLSRGVIIRNLKSYGLNAVRITIGTPSQNNRFFELARPLLRG